MLKKRLWSWPEHADSEICLEVSLCFSLLSWAQVCQGAKTTGLKQFDRSNGPDTALLYKHTFTCWFEQSFIKQSGSKNHMDIGQQKLLSNFAI